MSPGKLALGQAAVHKPPRVGSGIVNAKRPAVALDGRKRGAEPAAVQCQK